MTDFRLRVEIETNATEESNNCSAEIYLYLDPESRKAIYEWLAAGCDTDLVMSRKGCRAAPTSISVPEDSLNELKEWVAKRLLDDSPCNLDCTSCGGEMQP